jgi:hypothetical protein
VNPVALALSVYVPGVMLRKLYSPALLEADVRSTEVSTLCSTIVAFVTSAPLESRTDPLSEAVESWASPALATERMLKNRHTRTKIPGE